MDPVEVAKQIRELAALWMEYFNDHDEQSLVEEMYQMWKASDDYIKREEQPNV